MADQTGAQIALAPFLALAKSATSPRAAADLVSQATSASGTYLFAELLTQPNIEALRSDAQYGAHHKLLEIFAWGTWESYQSDVSLPRMNDAQTLKLRLLSLISYASEKHGDLSYATLCRRLGFDTNIDLEHLVTTAIYTNLITATLNPAEQTILVSSVAPLRDLVPGSIQCMLADLQSWSTRCEGVLASLEAEIAKIKSEASKRAIQQAKQEKQFQTALDAADKEAERRQPQGLSGLRLTRGYSRKEQFEENNPDGDFDPMDIDGQATGVRKKSGGSMFGFMSK